jgi:hypothetical protein
LRLSQSRVRWTRSARATTPKPTRQWVRIVTDALGELFARERAPLSGAA